MRYERRWPDERSEDCCQGVHEDWTKPVRARQGWCDPRRTDRDDERHASEHARDDGEDPRIRGT